MPTNTAGTTARQLPWQATHYLRKTIAYNTSGIGTDETVVVGVLPAGAVIDFVMMRVNTAFNAAGNNLVNVGKAGDDDLFADETDWDATVAESQRSYRGGDAAISADTTVYVTYDQTSTAATAGEAEIIVAYFPDNDG